MKIKIARITPAGKVERIEIENNLQGLYKAIDGGCNMIQALFFDPVQGKSFHAYVDEDGISRGQLPNRTATRFCEQQELGLLPGDFIKGNMILCGDDGEGNDADLPHEVFQLLKI